MNDNSIEQNQEAEEYFDDDYKQQLRYEYLIMISFWLSIHMGHHDIVNMILEQDELIKKFIGMNIGLTFSQCLLSEIG